MSHGWDGFKTIPRQALSKGSWSSLDSNLLSPEATRRGHHRWGPRENSPCYSPPRDPQGPPRQGCPTRLTRSNSPTSPAVRTDSSNTPTTTTTTTTVYSTTSHFYTWTKPLPISPPTTPTAATKPTQTAPTAATPRHDDGRVHTNYQLPFHRQGAKAANQD